MSTREVCVEFCPGCPIGKGVGTVTGSLSTVDTEYGTRATVWFQGRDQQGNTLTTKPIGIIKAGGGHDSTYSDQVWTDAESRTQACDQPVTIPRRGILGLLGLRKPACNAFRIDKKDRPVIKVYPEIW